jgi:hypothetical protein
MCRLSASEYDISARTSSKPVSSKPARSLVEVLRDLFRPRRPQVAQAEVVPLRAGGASRTDHFMPTWLVPTLKWGGVVLAIVSAIALTYVQVAAPPPAGESFRP